jgi:hypothetical protein
MPLDNDRKEKIALEVIRVLKTRADSFDEDTVNIRNAPFHKSILQAFSNELAQFEDPSELIGLSSWLHGLNTTFGYFFENIANILSNGKKIEFSQNNGMQLTITRKQESDISQIITDLKNSTTEPNLITENQQIFEFGDMNSTTPAMNFTADVYIENSRQIIAYEMKSVRPNSGEMRGEKQKILIGKAALKLSNPNKEVIFYIGFPFDFTQDSMNPLGSNKQRFMEANIELSKFFDPNEVLLAEELWNSLSGDTETMGDIIELINEISTADFKNIYEFINNYQNYIDNNVSYMSALRNFYMYSEIALLEEITTREDILRKNKTIREKINLQLHKPVFTTDGKYNMGRRNTLSKIISTFDLVGKEPIELAKLKREV